MVRRIGVSVLLSAVTVVVAACGFSEQEAADRCEQERVARQAGGCFDGTTLASCVTAYEDCGSDANVDDALCPLTYSCPE
jgi:hypothetical protein